MYPNNPPPGGKSEYDQYPLNQFTAHEMDRSSPFSDPYPQENPGQNPGVYDHQPLLHHTDTPGGFHTPGGPPPPGAGGPPPPFAPPSPHANFVADSPQMAPAFSPDSPNLHYGAAPRRQPRRFKTTRKVKLTRGNLVLDCPVPTRYLQSVPLKDAKEFTHMRYTGATCDPKDFGEEGYTLRQQLLDRKTELFIVLTMYNEDEVLFARTMHGVMKNIAHLCTRDRSRTW